MSTKVKGIKLKDDVKGNANGDAPAKRRPSSLPLSVFSKTFIAMLLVQIIVLTGLGLAVQQPVVLILAGVEAFVAALTVFGLRWVPFIGSILGFLMLLIFLTATGFPVHHLTHPKDAFGYGVIPVFSFFVYMVMTGLFWSAAMLIITGITTVIHNYFLSDRHTFPWFKTALTGAICIWCGAVLVGALTQPDKPVVALNSTTVTLQVGSFSQSSITLTKGDKLTIIDSGAYHHNLSMGRWINGQPVIQSQPGAPELKDKDVNAAGATVIIGPFNTAGTFYLMCSLHNNMMLKIIVQ